MKKIVMEANDTNQRVDRFLMKHLPNANKNFIMRMIRKKNIILNGKKIDPSYLLQLGDEISIYFSDETYEKFRPSKKIFSHVRLDIVYEDRNILILDKPTDLLSHVAKNLKEKNLIDGAIKYLIEKNEYSPKSENSFTPALANRLDRNTSGLVIVGKNSESLKEINSAIKENSLEKYYHAIVEGKFDCEGRNEICYRRNDRQNVSKVSKSGKNMISEFSLLKSNGKFSIIEIKLITGRTHQIRLQLANLGFPIVGDKKYGSSYYFKSGQLLVATDILFPKFNSCLDYLSNKKFTSRYKDKIFEEYERLIK